MTAPAPPRPLPAGAGRGRRLALFLDIDGAIAEIAPRPELARVPAGTRAALARLRRALGGAVAVVSGRPLAQIDRMLPGADLAAAGLHGLELRRAGEAAARRPAPPLPRDLAAALRRLRDRRPGLVLEDKGATAALHYRACPELGAEARAAVRRLLDGRPGLAALEGKCVIEVKPAGRDKGTAIRAFMAEPPFAGREPAFLGDDVTDEAGFAVVREMGGLAVRVGGACATRAAWRLPDVAAAREWLRSLADSFDDDRGDDA